jgi:hypothetical protein
MRGGLTIRERAEALWADHKAHPTTAMDCAMEQIAALATPQAHAARTADLNIQKSSDQEYRQFLGERPGKFPEAEEQVERDGYGIPISPRDLLIYQSVGDADKICEAVKAAGATSYVELHEVVGRILRDYGHQMAGEITMLTHAFQAAGYVRQVAA